MYILYRTPPLGVGHSHRDELRNAKYSEREWLNLLLDEYDEWAEEINDLNENNATWLGRAQSALMVSIGYLFVSAFPILTPVEAKPLFVTMTVVLGVLLLAQFTYSRLT